MAKFRLSPAAQRDLDGIFDYTIKLWGREQAIRYVDLLASACASAAESPYRAPACDIIRKGYRRRSVGRHIIYFQISDPGISVVRILHHRMNARSKL